MIQLLHTVSASDAALKFDAILMVVSLSENWNFSRGVSLIRNPNFVAITHRSD
jgi:hypothetical protein